MEQKQEGRKEREKRKGERPAHESVQGVKITRGNGGEGRRERERRGARVG